MKIPHAKPVAAAAGKATRSSGDLGNAGRRSGRIVPTRRRIALRANDPSKPPPPTSGRSRESDPLRRPFSSLRRTVRGTSVNSQKPFDPLSLYLQLFARLVSRPSACPRATAEACPANTPSRASPERERTQKRTHCQLQPHETKHTLLPKQKKCARHKPNPGASMTLSATIEFSPLHKDSRDR